MKTTTTNLFATATKVKETTKKTDKKVISSPILGNKIQRYAELKQLIDSATGELKMIEGDIKSVGKDLFMKEQGLQLEGTMTVQQFISITKDKYGGDIISSIKYSRYLSISLITFARW